MQIHKIGNKQYNEISQTGNKNQGKKKNKIHEQPGQRKIGQIRYGDAEK
jgi:hypothetical protein